MSIAIGASDISLRCNSIQTDSPIGNLKALVEIVKFGIERENALKRFAVFMKEEPI